MVSTYTVRVGTRPSKLAIAQVKEVFDLLRIAGVSLDYQIITFETTGDIDKNTPISEVEGTDFFTDSIELALLKGEIDIAIHSAKDLPDKLPQGLTIAAITKSIDPYDALVVRKDLNYKSLDELPYSAKIGTSSTRRKTQIKTYRHDLQIVDIRGNIDERIELLDNSDLCGIVVASAGLIRLGLGKRITQKIPFEIIKPHPLQGCLAVEVKKESHKLIEIFSLIDFSNKTEVVVV